jgi:hypothetical protein
MGNPAIFKLLQDELKRGNFFIVRFAYDDSRVARRQRRVRLMLILDRARAIDECVGISEKICLCDIELDAHAVIASLLACVADGILVGRCALPGYGPCACEDRFQ